MESLVWRKVKPLVAVRSGYGSRRSARHSIGHRTGRETTEGGGGTSRGLPVSGVSACQPKSVTGWSSGRGQAHHRDSFEGTDMNDSADNEWHPRPVEPVENPPSAVSQRRQDLQQGPYTPLLLVWAKTHEARPPAAFTI